MTEQTQTSDQGVPGASANQGEAEVTTEGSARVLNEVKGRLERIETGDLPVIERIGADGTSRRVDQTGEMIRPDADHFDAARLEAVNEAAEAFATQHRASAADEPPATTPSVKPTDGASRASEPERTGLWARIMSWFRRG